MNLSADSYFCIGSAHLAGGRPCQDYSDYRITGDRVIGVVSDGCSTGGRTDIGSRIVALAAMQAARVAGRQSFIANHSHIINGTRYRLGINKSDLLATCLFVAIDDAGAYFHLQGDGVTAVKYRDGSVCMSRFDWANNTPFYPAYVPNGDLSAFHDAHGGKYTRALTALLIDDDGKERTEMFTAESGACGIETTVDIDNVEFMAVFSDGVTQIDGVDWRDAVRELLDFKNTAGEFGKRRAIRAIKDYKTMGRGNVDDFSFAVVRVLK